MSGLHADVLLAEDNPSDAELILETLAGSKEGPVIHRVHDGVEALDFLFSRGVYEPRGPDAELRLVLLDIKLPRVGGLEVLQQMRAEPSLRLVPVVMLTSSRIDRDVAAAYGLGANGYIQKPVDFSRFRDVVRCLGRFWLSMNQPPPRPNSDGSRGWTGSGAPPDDRPPTSARPTPPSP